ncbi:DNA terminal protein [Cytobacillus phage Bfsp1]|nr:DNA terminal protein [Cytobacillus phage Bfsp1]
MANKRINKKRDSFDKDEYKRLVKNAKAKMKRIETKYGLDVSDKIDIPQATDFNSRKEFNEWKDRMKSFTDRNNPEFQYEINKYGVAASKAELEKIRQDTAKAQEQAQKFIEKYENKPYSVGGKEMGYTVGDRMLLFRDRNVAGITVPDDFDFDKIQTRSRLEGRAELLEEKASGQFFDQSMERMKHNFMTALRGTFNGAADELLDMIDIIPPDDFFELFLMKAEFTFEDYASDGSIDGTDAQLEMLKSYVEEYFRGEIDMSLKHF